MKHAIFVYGTLKQGHGNHRVIAQQGTEFMGEAFMPAGTHRLFASDIPFLVKKPGADYDIHGEVYHVTDETLARLDRLEGHPHNYRRTQVTVIQDGLPVQVETYIYQRGIGYMEEVTDGTY